MSKAIYPGSFDPVTYGHLNIIERATRIFDQLVVAVAINAQKEPCFSPGERIEMLEQLLYDYTNVTVKSFSGLTADFVREEGSDAVIRGIRTGADLEYEKQMALLNRSLNPNFETIFLIADSAYSFTSSSFARELASYGGDVSGLVPPIVEKKLYEKFNGGK